jgi:hypothetical protein
MRNIFDALIVSLIFTKLVLPAIIALFETLRMIIIK